MVAHPALDVSPVSREAGGDLCVRQGGEKDLGATVIK